MMVFCPEQLLPEFYRVPESRSYTGGLPVRLEVETSGMTINSSGSDHTEGTLPAADARRVQ